MSFLLVAIAAMTAVNPARLAASLPPERPGHSRVAGTAGALVSIVVLAMAALSGPLLGWIGVTSSSSIIAAGVSLVVIGARDSVVAPPVMDQPPNWPLVVVTPVFFPTMFTPALALTAVAAGADRGVLVGFVAVSVGIVVSIGSALLVDRSARFTRGGGLRIIGSIFGLLAVAIGALVATRGVMSI